MAGPRSLLTEADIRELEKSNSKGTVSSHCTFTNERDIAINGLFFQVFQHGDEQLLSRVWLLDPVETQPPVVDPKGEKGTVERGILRFLRLAGKPPVERCTGAWIHQRGWRGVV